MIVAMRCPDSTQGVTGATNCPDRIALSMLADGFAQAADMNIHGARVNVDVTAPDPIKQLFELLPNSWTVFRLI